MLRLVVDRIRLPDGSISVRECVHHPGAAAILATFQNGSILLVRQYRHPVGAALWEIPAGKRQEKENALACAKRELCEESGYEATVWEELLTFYSSPGFCDEQITLFLARGLAKVTEPKPEEIAAQRAFRPQQLEKMIRSGEICDGKTLLALRFAEIHVPTTTRR